MIAMERSYDGDDPLLLAALAVVVHALESILEFLTRARRIGCRSGKDSRVTTRTLSLRWTASSVIVGALSKG